MTFNPTLHNMKHDKDPREAIIEAAGDVSSMRLSGFQVLVGTYIRPEMTIGGLMVSETTRKEDQYQGKVGVILKIGTLAFEGEELSWPDEVVPKVGDFVFYRVHDGFMMDVNGHPCRILESKQIRGVIDNPDIVI